MYLYKFKQSSTLIREAHPVILSGAKDLSRTTPLQILRLSEAQNDSEVRFSDKRAIFRGLTEIFLRAEMKRLRSLLRIALAAGLVLAATFFSTTPVPAVAQALTVARVIDGDTVELSDGRRLRLLGIDTPETSDDTGRNYKTALRIGAEAAWVDAVGREARRTVEEWVLHQPVTVEWDPQNQAIGHRDAYGRWLGYLYRSSDGLQVNGELIRQGYGLVYRRFTFGEKNRYLEMEKEAYANHAGLWRQAKNSPGMNSSPKRSRSRKI